jgi:hypothetical protein
LRDPVQIRIGLVTRHRGEVGSVSLDLRLCDRGGARRILIDALVAAYPELSAGFLCLVRLSEE